MITKTKNKIAAAIEVIAIVASMLFMASFLGSCASRQERAQHKLAKAISLDPTILNSYTSTHDSTVVRDSLVVRDSVTIIPKTETRINWQSPCDSTGRIKPIDFETGVGAYHTHIWTDSIGGLHFSNKIDSVVNHSKITDHTNQVLSQKLRTITKTIKIVEYKTTLWKLALAGVVGFFVSFILRIFKNVLSKST